MRLQSWIFACAVVCAVMLPLLACGPPIANEGSNDSDGTKVLRLFAAASLQDVAVDWVDAFDQDEDVELVLNAAGSNVLAQQIMATDGADVFLSADREWVDFLSERGKVVVGSQRDVLANRLVIVARHDSPHRVSELQQLADLPFRYLAMANEAVPAGRYGRSYLQSISDAASGATLLDALGDRLVPAMDVRAALALSETDPEILALVYRTDALASDRVQILFELPLNADIPIVYSASLVAGARDPELAQRFLDFLTTPQADAIAARHGFRATD